MTRERFIELVEQEQEGLRRFLLALCSGDSFEADDIAQDALVKAYVASDRFVEKHKFSTWLFRIAYNTFIDRRRTASGKGEFIDTCAVSVAALQQADSRYEYEELYRAISALSYEERSTILLFYMNSCSIDEISVIMNVPHGTVKSRLSRGRNHLRTALENDFDHEK